MTEACLGRTDDCPRSITLRRSERSKARGKNRSAANSLQPWDSESPKKVPRGDQHELTVTNEVEGQA